MKKLLFIISSDEYVRNYIRTGVIDSLIKIYDCKIVASSKIHLKEEVEKLKSFSGYYVLDPKEEFKRIFLMKVVLWRYRKKSTTFIYRCMRFSGLHDFNIFSSFKQFKEFLLFIKRNLHRNSVLFQVILGNFFIYPFYLFYFKRKLKLNKDLEKLIEKTKPELILFPSSAYDPIGHDIIDIGTENNIKTVYLIDNWDNLSSKTVYIKKPDYLTVWGEQSLEHAVDIHNFEKERVYLIGTPRFDMYYKMIENVPKSPIDGKYVLFTGAALEMDETGALKELDEELEHNKDIYGDLKIIYRPHPWRQGTYDFYESEFKHVELDGQMRQHYLKQQKRQELKLTRLELIDFQPDIAYYPAILGNALFLVAPLTTMAVEALINEKSVLVLVYDDGKNFTTPSNVFNYYEHFRGIENLKGFTFCKEKGRMKQSFREKYLYMEREGFKNIKSDLSYFLYNDSREYKQRLLDTIEDIYK